MDLDSAKALLGSPAWAGIDPSQVAPALTDGGFPRVGGDRPADNCGYNPSPSVPPRGRG